MAATLASSTLPTPGLWPAISSPLLRLARALQHASAQTSADLARAEVARARRLARDTAEAHAMARRYAQSAPSFASDIRAAIDRHESLDAARG